MPVDKKQLKEALLKTLAEKGDYTTILSHLSSEEKEEKDSQFKELIRPMSAVADILVGNATGAFTEPLKKHIDERAEELRTDFTEQLTKDKEELSQAIAEAFSGRNEEFTSELLQKFTDSQSNLSSTLTQLTAELIGEKATEMLSSLGEQAKLTEDEIEDIIEQAALSVESQITTIIGGYIEEQGISVSQIRDFTENVQKLLPQVDFSKISVDWSQVRNAPSQGGTNANLIRQIAQEIVDASGGGYTNLTEFVAQTPHRVFYSDASGDVTELALGADGTFLKSNGASSAPSFATPAGSGDVSKVGTPVNNQIGVWTGDGTIEGDVDLTFDTTTNFLYVAPIGLDGRVVTHAVRGDATDGLLIESANGTDVARMGVANTANVTFLGAVNIDGATRLATSLTGPLRADSGVVSVGTDNAGITRSVVVTSGSATMGATALTDYVYLVAGAHTMTLPTAVSNLNRYTVKNNHSAAITVDTTSAQTIDGTTTISINPQSSVDIISNNSNWFII